MKARFAILLLINILAVVGVVVFLGMGRSDQPPSQGVTAAAPANDSVDVLVAAANLPPGTLIQPTDIVWQKWPKENLSDTFTNKPHDMPPEQAAALLDSVSGSVVRLGIAKGAPIVTGAVIKPGEKGFLAAILAPGMRAISINISASSGGAGLIMPGDRVDVLLSQGLKVADASGAEKERRATETFIPDLRLIALDQKVSSDPADPVVGRTATLEVTPRQAEMLILGEDMGKLSLSLRSVQKADTDTLGRTVIWDYGASMAIGSQNRTAAPAIVRGGESK
ncbi:Flp pilus assembly protein CpaB [Emcibacter sp. SYSU 3D8]|uniref:Flp pilus assembly protein CpaB n=1 Tax=Emcibacter sp. SYSU 3D8 TaxID=3133969 RepID=UPI0031FEEB0D